jgi:hypothetical protein
MPASQIQEIDKLTAARRDADRRNPECFWGTCGRTLSSEESAVFGIAYADFPRLVTVWEAWFAFLGLVEGETFGQSREAIMIARQQHPELTAGNALELFEVFAREIGGLTNRQADAMFWKDLFWTVREGHVSDADERLHG